MCSSCFFCTFLSGIDVANQPLANNQQIIKKKIMMVADACAIPAAGARYGVLSARTIRTEYGQYSMRWHGKGLADREICCRQESVARQDSTFALQTGRGCSGAKSLAATDV